MDAGSKRLWTVVLGAIVGASIWGLAGFALGRARNQERPYRYVGVAVLTGVSVSALAMASLGKVSRTRMWRDGPRWRRYLYRSAVCIGIGALLGAGAGMAWAALSGVGNWNIFWGVCTIGAMLGSVQGAALGLIGCFVAAAGATDGRSTV